METSSDPSNDKQPKLLLKVTEARVRISSGKSLSIDAFRINAGEHWCVFGGNGAGKSLLARLLRGDLMGGQQYVSYAEGFDPKRDCDVVSFEEQQRLWAADNRHDISEYSDAAQDQGTTVASLICAGRPLDMLSDDRAISMISRLELQSHLERGIRFLSSGQIRKAMVAKALLGQQPDQGRLLLLDDPLEAIDRHSAPVVRELLRQWMDSRNATLLLCRRESELLPGITHLAVMEDLRIVAQGPVDQAMASEAYMRLAQPSLTTLPAIPDGPAEEGEPDSTVSPVRLNGVTAAYGDRVILNQLRWEMKKGDHTLIEGPNGSGKSTLLSLIDGENHKAYGQEVYLFGVRRGSGESVWDIKARFGIVSNEIHNKYVRGWKVLDVVVSGYFDSVGLYDTSGATQEEAAAAWLLALGLEALKGKAFHEISFGQQRLALLARAMVKSPAVLILDEPCVGLDDYYRRLILATVDLIAERTPTQIIYVSHTEGEEPRCINQRLRLEPAAGGGHQLVQFA